MMLYKVQLININVSRFLSFCIHTYVSAEKHHVLLLRIRLYGLDLVALHYDSSMILTIEPKVIQAKYDDIINPKLRLSSC